MADEIRTDREPHTTIIERRGGGGTMLIGLALLVAVLVLGFFVYSMTRNDNLQTKAITGAADSVGAAADKAGDAVDKATPDTGK